VPSPFVDAAIRITGRIRGDTLSYGLGSESECVIVVRTYVVSRLFYEAYRGPRLATLPENRPRRNQVAPGGGGNRTRVRGRTGQSVYKLSLHFEFRPDGWCAGDPPPG